MKTGRKPHTPTEKRSRGTFRADRDAGKTEIVAAGSAPVMPAYLTDAAVEVWREVLPRTMAAGTGEVDSAMLARYCASEANCRERLGKNQPVGSALLNVLRQYEEALHIGGTRSRVGVAAPQRIGNAFAKNGIRNRSTQSG